MATSKEERDQVAQERFGKTFDECDSMERIRVGAYIGGKRGGGRIHEMSEERKHQNREREGVVEEEDLGEEGEEQDETAELAEEGMEGEERGHGRQPQ